MAQQPEQESISVDYERSEVNSPFSINILPSAELMTDVITLKYEDNEDPLNNYSVKVTKKGSNMMSLEAGGIEFIEFDPERFVNGFWTGNFVAAPTQNRIWYIDPDKTAKDPEYKGEKGYRLADGRFISLESRKRKEGNESLDHGIFDDIDWEILKDSLKIDKDSAQISTRIAIEEGTPLYEFYPFAVSLTLTYILSREGMTVGYTINYPKKIIEKDKPTEDHEKAGQKEEMLEEQQIGAPFGLALHPFFKKSPGSPPNTEPTAETNAKMSIVIPATRVVRTDEELLPLVEPAQRELDVTGTMWSAFDARLPRNMSDFRKIDHTWTGFETTVDANKPIIIAYEPQEHLQRPAALIIGSSKDCTHAVVFAQEGRPDVAVEPERGGTNAINLDPEPITVMPGQQIKGYISYGVVFGELPQAA